MKKKTILFGSLFAVFILVMVPNINALEFRELKEDFKEKNDHIISIFNALANRNINVIKILSTNLIILLTIILQSIINVVMGLAILTISGSTDSDLISFIYPLLAGAIVGWLFYEWDERIYENHDVSVFQEVLLELVPWFVYAVYSYYVVNAESDSTSYFSK